jgi:hypothetical protein
LTAAIRQCGTGAVSVRLHHGGPQGAKPKAEVIANILAAFTAGAQNLRAEDINVVAIHHHMTHEQPHTLFLHYWGKGKAESLARSLKKTLDAQRQ